MSQEHIRIIIRNIADHARTGGNFQTEKLLGLEYCTQRPENMDT